MDGLTRIPKDKPRDLLPKVEGYAEKLTYFQPGVQPTLSLMRDYHLDKMKHADLYRYMMTYEQKMAVIELENIYRREHAAAKASGMPA